MALTKIPTHMLFSGAASEDLSIDSDTLFIDSSENRVGIANNSPSVALDVTGSLTVSGTITGADLEIDSGTFSIDSSNNRVGIGTTSPSEKLHIKGDGARIEIGSADYTNVYLGRRGSSGADLDTGLLNLKEDGTSKVQIDANGNTYFNGGSVGIGTSSPSSKLHINSASDNEVIRLESTDTEAYIHLKDSTGSSYIKGRADVRFEVGGNDVVQMLSGETVINNGSNDYDFRVESNGNTHMLFVDGGTNSVGIGGTPTNGGISGAGNPTLAIIGSVPELNFVDSDGSANDYWIRVSDGLQFGEESDSRMYLANGGNLGIGTTTVPALLTLADHDDGTMNEMIRLVNDPGSSTSVGTGVQITFANHHSGTEVASVRSIAETTGAGTGLQFYTHSGSALKQKLRINKDGNIFLTGSGGDPTIPSGMASSSYVQLKIGGGILADSGHSSGHNIMLGNNVYVGASNDLKFTHAAAAAVINMSSGDINFRTHDGGGASADATATLNSRLYIKENGQVGIGNQTSPSYRLDVKADGSASAFRVASSTNGQDLNCTITNSGTNSTDDTLFDLTTQGGAGDPKVRWSIAGNENYEMGIDNSDSDKLKIAQGSALGTNDIMTFTAGQDVGIGTASPSTKLYVYNSGGGSSDCMTVQSGSTANSNVGMILFRDNDQDYCGQITTNGSTNTTIYNANTSDERLKENITDWEVDALSLFKNIEPKEFNFKSQDEGAPKVRGYIAQTEASKFPEAFTTDSSEEAYYSYNPSGMVIYLMKALKEQVAINEALEARIKTLEDA